MPQYELERYLSLHIADFPDMDYSRNKDFDILCWYMLILMDNLGRPYIQAPQFLLLKVFYEYLRDEFDNHISFIFNFSKVWSNITYVQCKRRNRHLVMDDYKYIFHGDSLPHNTLQ